MKKRIFSIICIVILLLMYSMVIAHGVYNVPIKNGTGPMPNITQNNGVQYVNGGTGEFITKYKNIAVFVSGLGTISMVGAMLYNIVRLNTSMGNPMQRSQCLKGILVCGIFAALLGSTTMIIGLFYGALR